jgi:DNA processing protein
MNSELLYQLSLSIIPGVGPVQAKILIEQLGTASAVFKTKESQLQKIEGIGAFRAKSIKSFTLFADAEKEIGFIEKYGIQPLFLTDAKYPRRLLNCYDSPTILFYKGNADLNNAKTVAVVGSRHPTEYGRHLAETFVLEMVQHKILVISGLAIGIDALAHRASLKHGLATVGVLGHGLDLIYPSQNKTLARDMMHDGGLLTEFKSKTNPDKHNFPMRNRIVAGMSDATVVIETALSGGSMITAELANGYNRDVFAFPGKTTDLKSAGCNKLIQNNKAVLLTEANDLLQIMNWETYQPEKKTNQRSIFIELNEYEKIIVALLQKKETVSIDELNLESNMSNSTVASALLNLELQNVIISLPGKMYRLA